MLAAEASRPRGRAGSDGCAWPCRSSFARAEEKLWDIKLTGKRITTRSGDRGAKGQMRRKDCATPKAARLEYVVKEKLAQGDVSEEAASAGIEWD